MIYKPSMLKCLSPSKPTRKKKKKWDDMKAHTTLIVYKLKMPTGFDLSLSLSKLAV